MKKKFMQLAIREARKNLATMHGGPFGACVVKGNRVLAIARNTVLKNNAACHAEVNAIRIASSKLKTYDLSGYIIYSTNEPCPMCFSAIHWAKIDTIVYGTKIADAKRLGFNELLISSKKMKRMGKSNVKIISGFMLRECRRLLVDWDLLGNKKMY